jgi:xanthine phosphoribosyltransferase
LATGKTIGALADIVEESGSQLVGIGAVIEKSFEGGRQALAALGVPIESAVIIDSMEDHRIVFR